MISFHKRDCFERAKELVERKETVALRYACLELRQCIESICYSKLKTYKKVVPESEFQEWLPKRVYEFLLEMEPTADQSYSVKIYSEDRNGDRDKLILQDNHETLTLKEIKKIYNKLGYYLHTPTISKQNSYLSASQKLQTTLEKFIKRIEPIVNTTFDMRLGKTVSFECEDCKHKIYHNADTLKVGKAIRCLKENCGMMYVCEEEIDGKYKFKPNQFVIDCECGESIFINYYKLKVPSHISCDKCKTKYNIDKHWAYNKET
ncbi:hypothetical protein [Colwellia sp. E2M01]|uniref:hypothetical protein n=1 Tax=Colwellia sp. E2M01 TaxID=2841561 RepID=UPI001C0A4B85|nr:hypothetical protein [Colwellia sp. E2M01]MBU2871919.1 hypothetical protein [Colwellia sp. E2M01]